MKTTALLISLSCLAAGLAFAIPYVQRPRLAGQDGPVATAVAAPANAAAAPGTEPGPKAGPKAPFSWRQVEAEDYHQYIANLRAVGCPEQTIRDIIIADVNKLYAARENPLKTEPKPTADGQATESPAQKLERLKQLRALQQEKRWVVKELLGVDIPLDMLPSSGTRDYHAFEVALRALPLEKRDAVQLLQETYWQQTDALKAKSGKKQSPEAQAEAQQLAASLREQLAKTLTPEEMEEYEMRTSATAKQLSTSLATHFQPSEEEFRKIFRAKRQYEDTIQPLSGQPQPVPLAQDPAEKAVAAQQRAADQQAIQQARTAASTQLNEQLKTALGEDRYKQYEQSQDRTYDLLARLGQRYGLPAETVQQAYEIQSGFKGQAAPTQGQVQPTDPAALQKQLEERLAPILGEQALRGYRRVNGGSVPVK